MTLMSHELRLLFTYLVHDGSTRVEIVSACGDRRDLFETQTMTSTCLFVFVTFAGGTVK